jgi:hypothetical protein
MTVQLTSRRTLLIGTALVGRDFDRMPRCLSEQQA